MGILYSHYETLKTRLKYLQKFENYVRNIARKHTPFKEVI